MERTVPVSSSEEIELYLRTIYSLLRSSNEVQIKTLEEAHAGMNSSLHSLAREPKPDISALVYSLQRLPSVIIQVERVILGQTAAVFIQNGVGNVEEWQEVSAKARRRRCFFDGKDQLACYIASRSDIDDVVPILTALQIEWNKLHWLLNTLPEGVLANATPQNPTAFRDLGRGLRLGEDDLARLYTVLGQDFTSVLETFASRQCSFKLRSLNGSLNDYRRATGRWWDNIETQYPELTQRPIYFTSSNTHSLPNLLTSFAVQHQDELLDFIQQEQEMALQAEWGEIHDSTNQSIKINYLNYLLKKYTSNPAGKHLAEAQSVFEAENGILRIPSIHAFDIEATVIDISKLQLETLDPRILDRHGMTTSNLSILQASDAIIFNIDYPLGFAAYNLLTKIAENVQEILGIYIMGKAASLNGVRGDVIIPNVVYDEHSKNTYLFDNHFSGNDIAPYLTYGSVLDNQKSVSVLGTFLQNANIMDVVYREGYTDIEMEAGPYLSAIYELGRPQRHPSNQIIDLHKVPMDLGILHYVSDTPMTKGRNLGAGSLSYHGMDSTYAVSLAILRRIFELELNR